MSECVVRMEMPEDCRTCPFSTSCSFCEGYSDYCVLAPDGTKCGWSFMDGEFPTERPSWCPIICQLPNGHGRLVDADAFSGHMKEYQEKIMEWRERSKTEGPEESYHRADSSLLTVVATKLILDNAPTIVPAERSET